MARFTPLHDRVIIMRDEPKTRTTAGLIIPDTAQQWERFGTVVGIGPGCTKVFDDPLVAGDRVLLNKLVGHEITLQHRVFYVLREVDVLSKIEGDTDCVEVPCQCPKCDHVFNTPIIGDPIDGTL